MFDLNVEIKRRRLSNVHFVNAIGNGMSIVRMTGSGKYNFCFKDKS